MNLLSKYTIAPMEQMWTCLFATLFRLYSLYFFTLNNVKFAFGFLYAKKRTNREREWIR
jgi:hypothetical protein